MSLRRGVSLKETRTDIGTQMITGIGKGEIGIYHIQQTFRQVLGVLQLTLVKEMGN